MWPAHHIVFLWAGWHPWDVTLSQDVSPQTCLSGCSLGSQSQAVVPPGPITLQQQTSLPEGTTQTLLPTPQTALAMSVWWRRQRGGGVYLQPWDENHFSPTFFLTHRPNCIFKPLLTRRSSDEQRECFVKEFAEQRCSPSISCCLRLLSLHFWSTFKINYAMM